MEDNDKLRAFGHNEFEDYYTHGMRDYSLPSRIFNAVVDLACYAFTKVVWHWTVEDQDKLLTPEKDGTGRVIVMNHTSMHEPVACISWFFVHHMRIRPIFKSEFNHGAFLTWFFSRVGGIPVERGTADMRAIRCARAALARGEYVLIYPEGTRIRTDDQPVEVHGGFALIAQLAKAEVQPMAQVGARQITPQGTHKKRLFWQVYLKAGDPIGWDEIPAGKKKQRSEAMERLAVERMYALRDELRREHPGKE